MQRRRLAAVQLFGHARDFLVRTKPTISYGEITPHTTALGEIVDRITALTVAPRIRQPEAVDDRAHHLGRRAATTAALTHEVTRGRQVLSLVDLMVGPSAERDAVLAAEWKEVLRGRGARR